MGKQCLDIQQMQHLKELGVDTSKASMALIYTNSNGDVVDWENVNVDVHESSVGEYNPYLRRLYGAFTLQDIFDFLPKSTKYGQLQIRFCEYPNGAYGNEVVYDSMTHNGVTFFCENVIDSAYEMLCLCIKEGFVKTNKGD